MPSPRVFWKIRAPANNSRLCVNAVQRSDAYGSEVSSVT